MLFSLTELEALVTELATEREQQLRMLPNLLANGVPIGRSDDDNEEVSRWGEPTSFAFEPRNHVELGTLTETIDFERAGKVSGSAFYYLKNEAALLELALCQYAASKAQAAGYTPISTPDLCRDTILELHLRPQVPSINLCFYGSSTCFGSEYGISMEQRETL